MSEKKKEKRVIKKIKEAPPIEPTRRAKPKEEKKGEG